MRYIVRWCDHEGLAQEDPHFTSFAAAKAEAERKDKLYDGAEVVTPAGKRLWPTEWDHD